ncbi:MAG: hypothetical protein PHE15_05600 [Dehalococcoidales bacterium]|nr:hypothetical protein [Dehalococcoidales bacterium]
MRRQDSEKTVQITGTIGQETTSSLVSVFMIGMIGSLVANIIVEVFKRYEKPLQKQKIR